MTAHQTDELRLHDNELQLHTLNNTIPINIAHCTHDHHYRFANHTYTHNLLNLNPTSIPNKPIIELIDNTTIQILKPFQTHILQNKPITITYTITFKSTNIQQIHTHLIPKQNNNNTMNNWIEMIKNMTEHTKIEHLLYQHDHKFKTLIENTPNIITHLNHKLQYHYINTTIETILKLKTTDFIEHNNTDLNLPTTLRETIETNIHQIFKHTREHTISLMILFK